MNILVEQTSAVVITMKIVMQYSVLQASMRCPAFFPIPHSPTHGALRPHFSSRKSRKTTRPRLNTFLLPPHSPTDSHCLRISSCMQSHIHNERFHNWSSDMLQETLPACCLQFSRGIGKPPLARAQPDFRRHEGTGNNLRPLLPPATHSARARRSLLSKVGQKSIPRKTRGVILYEGSSADTSCKMVRFEMCTYKERAKLGVCIEQRSKLDFLSTG